MKYRYIKESVEADLGNKMVFVGGPRQVGKTTFALSLLGSDEGESSPAYLSWDALEDRENIMAGRLPAGQSRIILDEIHKYAKWRNLTKGLFDKNKSRVSFIVTGSARLDYYRKGGDSLQGRYPAMYSGRRGTRQSPFDRLRAGLPWLQTGAGPL